MGYTILTGGDEGEVDRTLDDAQAARAHALELVRQGRRGVRVVDENGHAWTAAAFAKTAEGLDMAKQASILVVEDDEHDLHFMLEALARVDANSPVEVARDGVEAVQRLIDPDGGMRPTVMLLDVKLPRLTGHEVLEQVRRQPQFAQMPIVMLSSSRAEVDVDKAYALGANAYVVKPLTFGALVEAVEATAKFWLKRNAPPPLAPVAAPMA